MHTTRSYLGAHQGPRTTEGAQIRPRDAQQTQPSQTRGLRKHTRAWLLYDSTNVSLYRLHGDDEDR